MVDANSTHFGLSGKRVLVTGGTGFIGGRLVERLSLQCKVNVRVLVRNFARVPRITRFPIEIVHGDVTSPGDVDRAVRECEMVFHCAYGNEGSDEMQRLINVVGTRNVLAASLRTNVKRIVYLSTLMVYGATADGDLDETAPRRYFGNAYSNSKLDAEKIAFDYAEKHSLPVTVLQPTAVYGPFAPFWTLKTLRELKTGQVILVNGGDGLCNAVYIDDLVSAMLLAAVKENAVGEAFLISGERPVTWRHFFSSYERMLGFSSTVSMSAAEANAYYAWEHRSGKSILKEALSILREEALIRQRVLKTLEVAALMKVVRLLLPEQIRRSLKGRIRNNHRPNPLQIVPERPKPIYPLSPLMVKFYTTKTRICIDKAKRILGYQPAFDLESGMRLTGQWVRWTNLLNQDDGLHLTAETTRKLLSSKGGREQSPQTMLIHTEG